MWKSLSHTPLRAPEARCLRCGDDGNDALVLTQLPATRERIDSADLFRFARRVRIQHGGDVYTLTLTSQNKLILTK